MKRLLFFSIFITAFALSSSSTERNIHFPDTNFKEYLVEKYDTNDDGEISYQEALKVTEIDCDESGIKSLEGIEHFVNLTNLSCESNQLTSIDVSKNTRLTRFNCDDNQLTSLDVSKNTALSVLGCCKNQLTSLDVSKNTTLSLFACTKNQLTSIDISNNTALTNLFFDENQLTSIDISNNTALTQLFCNENQLTSLDVSNNTALDKFTCHSNQLTSLDVSKNTALTQFNCANNQLTSLDLSNNNALIMLSFDANELSTTDMSKNTALVMFSCADNQLTSLDVSKCRVLTHLYCAPMATLTTVILKNGQTINDGETDLIPAHTNISYVKGDSIEGNIYFPDVKFKAYLVGKYDTNDDGEISYEEAVKVTEIDCRESGIKSLEGIEHFVRLANLWCSDNQLTSLDVSKHYGLNKLDCSNNQLTSLNISKNALLNDLRCSDNQLTTLDISKNNALAELDCSENHLTTLDVSNNPILTNLNKTGQKPYIYIPDAEFKARLIEEYDTNNDGKISHEESRKVTEINCDFSEIKSLEGIEHFVNLTHLSCRYSHLTTLDVSKNPVLESLECGNNQLITLDISNNTELNYLDCSPMATLTSVILKNGQTINDIAPNQNPDRIPAHTKVLYLDGSIHFPDAKFKAYLVEEYDRNDDGEVSYEEALKVTKIDCDFSEIKSLEGIEHFVNLTHLSCRYGLLASLDISRNIALESLECNNNKITTLDLSKNTALVYLNCSPMETLTKVILKTGQTIEGIAPNKNPDYIPAHTNISYVD